MNLKQLEYFVAIAEEGQITAAARRLSISQPPLSYELAQLERELGVELVRRGPRGVTLTDAGRILHERATAILALSRAAAREVSSVGQGLAGTLCLAVADSAAGMAPAARLSELGAHYPDVSLEVRSCSVAAALDLVLTGVAEVGVVRTPFPSRGLRCRYAKPEPLVAIMPAAFEVGSELSVSLSELAGVPLVADAHLAEAVRAQLEARGLAAHVACVTDDVRTTCACAAAGLGVGLVPQSLLRVCDTGEQFIKAVAERDLETRAAVIWKADRTLSPLAEHVIALLGDLS